MEEVKTEQPDVWWLRYIWRPKLTHYCRVDIADTVSRDYLPACCTSIPSPCSLVFP